MSIDIRLPNHDYSCPLPKEQIIEKFPESLFGLTLDQDKGAKEIVITMPVVTPSILNILKIILEARYDDLIPYLKTITDYSHIKQASKYLLIQELSLFSSQVVTRILRLIPYEKLISKEFMNINYGGLVHQFMSENDIELVEYIFEHVLPNGDDMILVFDAILLDQLEILKMFLSERQIDPHKITLSSAYMPALGQWHIEMNSYPFTEDDNHNFFGDDCNLTLFAIYMNRNSIVEYLLSSFPEISGPCQLLQTAHIVGNHEIIVKLIQMYQYDKGTLLYIISELPFFTRKGVFAGVGLGVSILNKSPERTANIQDIYKNIYTQQKWGKEVIYELVNNTQWLRYYHKCHDLYLSFLTREDWLGAWNNLRNNGDYKSHPLAYQEHEMYLLGKISS